MATGIRNLDPDQTRDLLQELNFGDGPDGYVSIGEELLTQIKELVQEGYDESEAQEMLETISAVEDLADAATDGVDEDSVEMADDSLIGFTRSSNSIKRVTPPRLCAIEGQTLLVIGGTKIPVQQDGKELSVGRLTAGAAEDYSLVSKTTQKDPIHFHYIRFQDSSNKDLFDVAAYVKQDIEHQTVKQLLKDGTDLSEILAAPGGGGAMRLSDFLPADTPTPWTGEITSLNVRESDSKFAVEGLSFSVTLSCGTTVYLRGEAEKIACKRRARIEADLAKSSGSWQLKVTDIGERDGRITMKTALVNAGMASKFASMLKASDAATKGELPAAKEEEPKAEEEAPKPAAKRRNAFAKK